MLMMFRMMKIMILMMRRYYTYFVTLCAYQNSFNDDDDDEYDDDNEDDDAVVDEGMMMMIMKIMITRSIQRTQTPPRLSLLTCDVGLVTRSRTLKLSRIMLRTHCSENITSPRIRGGVIMPILERHA